MKNKKINDLMLGTPLSDKAKRIELLYDEVCGEKRIVVAQDGELLNVLEGKDAEFILSKLTNIEIVLSDDDKA